MTLVKKLLPFVIVLGVISYVLVTAFGMDNNLIHPAVTGGIKYYTFDLRDYLSRIQNIWTSHVPSFELLAFRTDIKIIPDNIIDVIAWLKLWGHNWAVTISWLMSPISALTWIGNWVLFFVQMFLALIGFPNNSTLLTFIDFLKSLANIPNEVINGLANM